MINLGPVYLALTGALLLVALVLGFRVLRGIAREGRDRQRRRRAGKIEKYTDDEEYGRGPPSGSGDDRGEAERRGDSDGSNDPAATCPHCGADNDTAFDYCRRCASPLPPGG